MREILMPAWKYIQRKKRFRPLYIAIVAFMNTRVFNFVMDTVERTVSKRKIDESKRFFLANKERIKSNVNVLNDEKSRRVYIDFIKYRGTLKWKYLHDVDKDTYFDKKIIKFAEKEIFIDAGAYTGDTVEELCRKFYNLRSMGGHLHVICFEPDSFNYKRCCARLSRLKRKYEGFTSNVICKGLWDSPGEVYFTQGEETSSKIVNGGTDSTVKLAVTSIDNVIGENNVHTYGKVTFIKMDIEGSEPQALEGARNTIERDHPRLAICIYHTDEQVISIIEWIRKNFPFYKLYVRHYHWSWTECVVYAVEK